MLEPHVAAYRLSLARGPTLAIPFSEVRGGLVIEWRLACDGWLSRQRLAFVGTLEEGGDLSHDVRFSSWEALDGSRMRYSYRSYGDEELQENFRGEARLDPSMAVSPPSASRASVRSDCRPRRSSRPRTSSRSWTRPAPAPRFVSHQVFDGGGFDSLTQITSVIGQPQTVEPLAQNTPLAAGRGR